MGSRVRAGPKSDIASPNNRPENERTCGALFSSPSPTNGKAVSKIDACLSANPFSPFLVYSLCFLCYGLDRQ